MGNISGAQANNALEDSKDANRMTDSSYSTSPDKILDLQTSTIELKD
jgi:hypothetical protein